MLAILTRGSMLAIRLQIQEKGMKQILLVICLVIGLNTMGEEPYNFWEDPRFFKESGIFKIEELDGVAKNPNIEVYCVRGAVMVVARNNDGLSAIQLLDPDVSPPRPMSCVRYMDKK